jgi:hypothetical protein
LIIPFLKYSLKEKTLFRNISRVIPAAQFELVSGFRKSFLFLLPILILAISLSWFQIVPLFLLWFLTIAIASFYNEGESLHVLKAEYSTPKTFLKRKTTKLLLWILIIYSPIVIVNIIFNFKQVHIILIFLVMQLILITFSIFLKYAYYKPNQKFIGNNIILSIVTIGSIIPYLAPIPLIMTIYYYRKAKKNLNNFLYD